MLDNAHTNVRAQSHALSRARNSAILILTPKRGAKGVCVNFATNYGILLRFAKHLNPCVLQTFLVMLDNAQTNVRAQLHALSRVRNSA